MVVRPDYGVVNRPAYRVVVTDLIPGYGVVLDDNGEVVIEIHFPLVNEPQLEAIFVLQCTCLEVAKHSGGREVVC